MSDIVSNTTIVSQALKNRWYDEQFLRVAEKNLVYQQLGQLNRKLPNGNGKNIFWTRFKNLAANTTAGAEGVATTAVGLSAENISATVSQYDGAVKISDLLAQTAMGDIMMEATKRLAYKASLSIDQVVRNAVMTGITVQNIGLSGAPRTVMTSWSSIPNTAVLTITELRKGVYTLMNNDANRPTSRVSVTKNSPDKVESDTMEGYWVCVISPDMAYGLMGDTSTGAWIDVNRYAGSGNIFKGEIGKLYGIRFLQTTNCYYKEGTSLTGIVSSGDVQYAGLFGADCFGVTTLQDLQLIRKDFGSAGTADPTNKLATVGYKTTFAAKVLSSTYGVAIGCAQSLGS